MSRHTTLFRPLLALAIVLAGVSVSEARVFGRWRGGNDYCYYNYYYSPAVAVSAQPAPSVPAPGQAAASTTGPTAYTAMKPVTGGNAAAPAATAPQGGTYMPAPAVSPGYYPSGGWSTAPRSSWDFGSGRLPPYH